LPVLLPESGESPVRASLSAMVRYHRPFAIDVYSDGSRFFCRRRGAAPSRIYSRFVKLKVAACLRTSLEPSQIIRNATKVMIPRPIHEIQ
jgi:hypothetical protein